MLDADVIDPIPPSFVRKVEPETQKEYEMVECNSCFDAFYEAEH